MATALSIFFDSGDRCIDDLSTAYGGASMHSCKQSLCTKRSRRWLGDTSSGKVSKTITPCHGQAHYFAQSSISSTLRLSHTQNRSGGFNWSKCAQNTSHFGVINVMISRYGCIVGLHLYLRSSLVTFYLTHLQSTSLRSLLSFQSGQLDFSLRFVPLSPYRDAVVS